MITAMSGVRMRGRGWATVALAALSHSARAPQPHAHRAAQGRYKDAFTKMFALIEDSGWELKPEGEEEEEGEDDEPPLPSVGMYG